MKKGKDLKAILKAARPKGLDEPALAFYESGLERGYSLGFEEGKRIGHEEGAKVWAAMAAENEKAAKPKAKA